jgi:hypothetical protein
MGKYATRKKEKKQQRKEGMRKKCTGKRKKGF